MNYGKALVAIFKGLGYCFGSKEVRSLALWPWGVGFVTYFGSLAGAYYLHPVVMRWAVTPGEGIWASIVYYAAWLGIGLALLVASMIVSITLVLIFTAAFQTAIAIRVLKQLDVQTPEEPSGVKGLVKETGRTLAVETAKLLAAPSAAMPGDTGALL